MPAKSKAQQKFFGMVHAMQKGDMSKKGHAGEVAKSISKKDAKDFASTSTKGLPKKVKEADESHWDLKDKVIQKKMKDLKKGDVVWFSGNAIVRTLITNAQPTHQGYYLASLDKPLFGIGTSLNKHGSEPVYVVKEETGKYAKTLFTADKKPIFIDDKYFDKTGTELIVKNENYHGKVYVYDPEQKDKFFMDPKDLYFARPKGINKLKEASSTRSKFKSGQTVVAKSNFQGLKTGENYKIVDVDVTWIMGQGYTAVTVKDKHGKNLVVNNPQIALNIVNESNYSITDWTTVKNEYWYNDKNRALAVKKYLESKGVKPKLYAAGNRYKLKWEWTKIQQDEIPASELEEASQSVVKNIGENDVNQDELKRGIEVEMEHTDDPKLAKKIALDHLAEIPDYYTRLDVMEKEAMKEDIIKLKPLIKESSFAALVKLPDSNTSFVKDRINKVASELNGKVDPYYEGGDAYKLIFKSQAGLKTFMDKARALFGRSGAEIELEENTDSGWSHGSDNFLQNQIAIGIFKRVYKAKNKDEINKLLSFYSKKYPHLKNAFAKMVQYVEKELK